MRVHTRKPLHITSKDSHTNEIKSFIGQHEVGKTNNDVKWLYFQTKIRFVPKNLYKVFPNLKCLTMLDCGLEKRSKEDLEGLENLECLNCERNKLTSLPDDLFADMNKLRLIFFPRNRIEQMSSKILMPILGTVEMANFNKNRTVDEWFDKESETNNDLTTLTRAIDGMSLLPSSRDDVLVRGFSSFRASGEFADLTIKVREKEFKIHKVIFAAQSTPFKKNLADSIEEVSKSFNKIKNFSVETFEAFVVYFYTGRMDNAASATEMFELASEFEVYALKTICIERILEKLDDSNALEVFNLSHHHQSVELKRKSFEVIKKMLPQLNDSLINNLDEINELMALKTRMLKSNFS